MADPLQPPHLRGPIASSGNILDLIELAEEEGWNVDCASEQVYNAYAEAVLS